jgi:carbamate kinase
MTKPTLVVALGGNALLRRGEPLEASIQRKNIQLAAETLSALCQAAHTGGNQPAGSS